MTNVLGGIIIRLICLAFEIWFGLAFKAFDLLSLGFWT